MNTKVCIRCSEELPIYRFSRQAANKDGLFPYCKDCKNLYDREWREQNKDKVLQYRKAYTKSESYKRLVKSEKYKEAVKRYANSPKGIAARVKHLNSEKGKATKEKHTKKRYLTGKLPKWMYS